MHISAYHRVNEFYSIADAEGEGSAWKLAVKNCDGSIEYIVERIGNEWFVDPNSPPFFLRTLGGAKAADERWRHNEGPAVVDLGARL